MRTKTPTYRWDAHATRKNRCALRLPAGFTILELVIVVLIMGILAAAAIPAFLESLIFYRVESAARRVKADLELVQQTARLTSAPQSMTFTGSSYALSAGAASLDRPNQAYEVDLAAEPFELDTVTVNFGGGPSVSFDGYGRPSSGGTVMLESKAHQCTVTLDATTGAVRIESNHSRGRTAQVPL